MLLYFWGSPGWHLHSSPKRSGSTLSRRQHTPCTGGQYAYGAEKRKRETREGVQGPRLKELLSQRASEPKVEPSSVVEKVHPAVVSIESEEPLSLRNSPRGPVIGQVQKGERVERQFEMYEAGEKWVFVKVATQNMAGFLESDSLETSKNPAR